MNDELHQPRLERKLLLTSLRIEQEAPMQKYSWFQITASVLGFLVVVPLLLPGLLLFALVNAPIFFGLLVPVLTIAAGKAGEHDR